MNGYDVMKNAYESIGDTKRARIFAFLASCDDEDKRTLYDSSAFNVLCHDKVCVRAGSEDDSVRYRGRDSLGA